MKIKRLLPLLIAALMLTACAEPAENEPVPENTETVIVSEADAALLDMHEVDAAPADKAAGNMIFYINGVPAHAGMVLRDALSEGVTSVYDLDVPVEPGHFSAPLTFRFPNGEIEAFIHAIVMNPTDTVLPAKECLIYSLNASNRDGMEVGENRFRLGSSTLDEVLALYGEPTDRLSWTGFDQLTYYSPLSSATFVFTEGKLTQANAYHISQLYQAEIDAFGAAPSCDVNKRDGYILLNRYFDTHAYLEGEGPVRKLSTDFTLDGHEISLGCKCSQLPDVWAERYTSIVTPLGPGRIMRVGLADIPEFKFYNSGEKNVQNLKNTLVMGAYLLNPAADNFGIDNSVHVPYSYMELTNESDLSEIVDTLGTPARVSFVSDDDHCFAWLFYAAENGDEAHFKVDLFTGEQIELRLLKYDKNAREY